MAQMRQSDHKEKPERGELIYKYILREYITPWYQSKRTWVTSDVYRKASQEVALLEQKKGKKQTTNKENEDLKDFEAVRNLHSGKPGIHRQTNSPQTPTTKQKPGKPVTPTPRQTAHDQNAQREQQLIEENIRLENKIKKRTTEIADLQVELEEKENTISRLRDQLEKSRTEIRDLTMRLSKIAGEKLRDNNPNITDLSDPNRPTELGTRFSNLYDDEWSDAYEAFNLEEVTRISILFDIVSKSYEFCETAKEKQIQYVKSKLLEERRSEEESQLPSQKTEVTSSIHSVLKNTRKDLAPKTAKNLAQTFIEEGHLGNFLQPYKLKSIDRKLEKFTRHCVELCWYMVICDPPVTISNRDHGKPFDVAVNKPYTKSVKGMSNAVIDYNVWPALYLHIGGPLVSKGVAQPKDGERK